jgi:hypothetical protein
MSQPIRKGATHKVLIGPVVAVGDGFTPVTTLDLATADVARVVLHDNAEAVDISGYTFAAVASTDGYYLLTLQAAIANTIGHMSVVINDTSLCLPVKDEFIVVTQAAYDDRYGASAVALAKASTQALVEKILRNKTVTDPVAGIITVYDDDDVTPLFTAPIFENAGGTQPYQGQGIDRRNRLT